MFILTVVFLIVSIGLILFILVQRPQGGGLAGAFGGAGGGGTDTAFGGRTGDVLTVGTVGAFCIYLTLAIVLNIIDNPGAAADVGEATPATETSTDGASTDAAPTDASGTTMTPVTTTPATTTPATTPAPTAPAPGQGG